MSNLFCNLFILLYGFSTLWPMMGHCKATTFCREGGRNLKMVDGGERWKWCCRKIALGVVFSKHQRWRARANTVHNRWLFSPIKTGSSSGPVCEMKKWRRGDSLRSGSSWTKYRRAIRCRENWHFCFCIERKYFSKDLPKHRRSYLSIFRVSLKKKKIREIKEHLHWHKDII